jgi:ABC-type transport system substrate-binding protein
VSFTGLQPNLQVKPFDDIRVTKGLRLLVDHQEAVTAWAEAWFGRGYVSIAFPAALSDWDLTEEEYAKHIEFKQPKDDAVRQGLAMLASAGYTRENPLVFPLNAQGGDGFSVSRAELLNAQFKRLSQNVVQTEIRFFPDPATARTALARGDFHYTIAALVAGQPFEPDDWFQTFYRTGGSRNYGKYSDRSLDQVIDRQKTIFDTGQRRMAIREILLFLLENAPYTSWSGRYTLSAIHPQVNDWAPEAISATWGYQYEQVWLDA